MPNRVSGWLLRFKKTGSLLPRLAIGLDSDVATTGKPGTCLALPCSRTDDCAPSCRLPICEPRRLVGASTAVVQEQEQSMISVTESRTSIRLDQESVHLRLLQIPYSGLRGLLERRHSYFAAPGHMRCGERMLINRANDRMVASLWLRVMTLHFRSCYR